MTPLLTILIPTLPVREKYLTRLVDQLLDQRKDYPITIQVDSDTDCQIGTKRNKMMAGATGDYVAWIDDDDRISDRYLELIMKGIKTKPTHCSLVGEITFNGQRPQKFIHSTDYTSMYEEDGIFYRPPNHLNTIRRDLAIQCPFPDWNFSEDSNFCFQLQAKGFLTNEYKIHETIYFYDFIQDKKRHDYNK